MAVNNNDRNKLFLTRLREFSARLDASAWILAVFILLNKTIREQNWALRYQTLAVHIAQLLANVVMAVLTSLWLACLFTKPMSTSLGTAKGVACIKTRLNRQCGYSYIALPDNTAPASSDTYMLLCHTLGHSAHTLSFQFLVMKTALWQVAKQCSFIQALWTIIIIINNNSNKKKVRSVYSALKNSIDSYVFPSFCHRVWQLLTSLTHVLVQQSAEKSLLKHVVVLLFQAH